MPEYLTPEEVEELLKLPRGKAKRLAKRGLLPCIKLDNGTFRFSTIALQKYLEAQENKAAKPALASGMV